MEPTFEEQARLDKAKKKVKAIKGFYSHLAAYLIVNIVLIIMHTADLKEGENFWHWSTFSTAFFWGIGLLCHAFGVFGTDVFLGSDWEERKIKEYMDKKPESHSRWE
ncbi:histidine kinase [Flavobacterium akiainvivens]|uniref:Histidine kinase n=1 Tax=Flavobacterium akiainvivens TaxID=1202724 RepID=A0A0M8ML97_9FLAO|nr:2TM domain-containing protein [Flavobacterium akiainvivens]KOS08117.1 histidine kinase [Flavobacterium akiainvivens]SFQ72047.1 2TM domain-containing protein [Flavobacterium akiainvivens]